MERTKDAADAARGAIRSIMDRDSEDILDQLEQQNEAKNEGTETQNIVLTYDPSEFDGTEECFWKRAAADMAQYAPPVMFRIVYGEEQVRVSIKKPYEPRIQGSLNLKKGLFPNAWYQKIDLETNQYDFFKIVPYNLGSMTLFVGGSYGRIGATKRDLEHEKFIKSPYQGSMYWVIRAYLEKDGYEDMSDILLEEEEAAKEDKYQEVEDEVSVELYNRLRKFAQNVLEAQVANIDFLSAKSPYTKAQINKAWRLWRLLAKADSVDKFNEILMDLMKISPRKVDKYRNKLESLLAKKVDDPAEQQKIFAEIIDREESLIRAMEAVSTFSSTKEKEEVVSPFGNIGVRFATEEEIERVKGHMSDQLKPLIANVYAITPNEQSEKLENYIKERNITTRRMFWHGSRNENWISIIKNSLMLNPNAVITGKMFGYGIYFAPSSMKSWGYTSYSGTRWAGGASSTAYMGLYETAYGTPYYPNGIVSGTKEMLDKMNPRCDCLHAQAGVCGLCNDEVIFYDESAICLRYLVEFGDV